MGIGFLVLVSVAFWPSLEGSEALTELEEMGEVMEVFGAQDMDTSAGYLDGQLFAVMLPLLLSGMAVAGVTAVTSGDEDAGRLELLHALPVSRRAVWLGRFAAAVLTLAIVTTLTAAVMALSLAPFSLSEAGVGPVVAATFACGALGVFHAAVGFLVGAAGGRRALAVGVTVAVLVASYVVNFLVPLSDALAGARKASPWYWALGAQPVSDGISPARTALLLAVSAALVAAGTVLVERRDIRAA